MERELNIADTTGRATYKTAPTMISPDMEQLYFELKDKDNTFQIGIKTLLECMLFAAKEKQIPDLPLSWYTEVCSRYDIPLSELIEFDNSSDLEPKRSKALTSYELNIYNTLKDNFDLAITFAEEHLGFHISNEKAKEMLSIFYHSNGWLYPHCTVNNIPFMLCYLQVAINPYGLFIRKDSQLERAIKKAHDLKLIPVKGNLGKSYSKLMPNSDRYLPLSMMIYDHDFKEDNDGTLMVYL